ncbi:MAG: AmmeMemoRadiSam system radical SAM enzyme [Bacillota bacterium]|nr:AmmeMemoRadiSam system radical SAM enzyme [Bacillota bacterium]
MLADHDNTRFSEREADYWQPADQGRVACLLCPHYCLIAEGQAGICRVRVNRNGRLIATAYGKITSLALDPIEKKPLHGFFRGSRILSVGSFGCNFKCDFCQNWSISQKNAPWHLILPEDLVSRAVQERRSGNIGLAFTYNEPFINYEYVMDCARLARKEGLKNVLVTNGSINPEPLDALLPWIDAMNIDLKSWQSSFYQQICHGKREPVLETIRLAARRCHVEITTLLIPGMNDAESDLDALASWIATIDPTIILHLTRYHPDYLMSEPKPITVERLRQLAQIAGRHLETVILGNI